MLASDIAAVREMKREELEARLVALWGDIRHRSYVSDLRVHLPDGPRVPEPPWQHLSELDEETEDGD